MHTGVILSTTSGWKSSRRIFENINTKRAILDQRVVIGGKSIIKRFNDTDFTKFQELDSFSYDKNIILIRYGTTASVKCSKNILTVYNTAKAIELASSKKLARVTLENAGIAVPKIITEGNPDNVYPLIARNDFHERGEDLYVCRDVDAYQLAIKAGFTYISELYPRTREFRVHCAHGKILMIHEKPMPTDVSDIRKCVDGFNNEDWEYVYWRDYDAEICKIALDATKALGLDFAGVDVMAFPSQDGYPRQVVCEVNTAPTLYKYGSEKYAEYFDWLFRSEKPRDHFDYTTIKKADKFAWRSEEFK